MLVSEIPLRFPSGVLGPPVTSTFPAKLSRKAASASGCPLVKELAVLAATLMPLAVVAGAGTDTSSPRVIPFPESPPGRAALGDVAAVTAGAVLGKLDEAFVEDWVRRITSGGAPEAGRVTAVGAAVLTMIMAYVGAFDGAIECAVPCVVGITVVLAVDAGGGSEVGFSVETRTTVK